MNAELLPRHDNMLYSDFFKIEIILSGFLIAYEDIAGNLIHIRIQNGVLGVVVGILMSGEQHLSNKFGWVLYKLIMKYEIAYKD